MQIMVADQDFVSGVRLLTIDAVPGESRLTLTLFDADGNAVADRTVRVSIGPESQAVVVLISRDCRGVECPASGNPAFDTCLGGRCVDSRCGPDTPEFCPEPECEQSSECVFAACAVGLCIEGVCLAESDSARCMGGEYCNPDEGCVSLPMSNPDAGLLDMSMDVNLDLSEDIGQDAVMTDAQVDSGPTEQVIAVTLEADREATDSVVSWAVPFPPGEVFDPAYLRITNAAGVEEGSTFAVLARWPIDGSIRSAILNMHVSLAAGESRILNIGYGRPRARSLASPIIVLPDGPVVAVFTAEWLTRSHVLGPQQPAAMNLRFPGFEGAIETALEVMSPAFESYAFSCLGSQREDFDAAHAFWTRYVRAPSAARYRRARVESKWYRENSLRWRAGRSQAVHTCQSTEWTPEEKTSGEILRRMTLEGMLNDYLLTGDPLAREAVVGLGETLVRNLSAQRTGENTLRVTERNLAWTLMGVASYYAVDPSPRVGAALLSLIDETVAWQADGSSGAFEHDIMRADSSECGEGPIGGSPFMTSLLIDALMATYRVIGDRRIPAVVVASAVWYRDQAPTSSGAAFQYLWGCVDRDYSGSSAELNNLIVQIFGAAYAVSGDRMWINVGDRFSDAGLPELFLGRPKQWTQSVRGFSRYLGYRSE